MTLENSGSGTLALTNNGVMQMAGAVAARTLTLTGANAGANSLAANIPDYSSVLVSLTKSGSGTWALTNAASTFSGNVAVTAGVLQATTLNTGGNASSIGRSTNVAASLTLSGGGVLEWIGATDQMTDRLFQITSASTGGLSASGTAGSILNVAATGAIKSTSTGVVTLLLGGSGGTLTKPNLFAPTLTDNGAGLMGLTKTGNGVWQIVNAANPMTGVVTLAGGKLLVNTLASGGVVSNIGAGTNVAGNIVFGGGTLTYAGAALDWNRLFSLSQGNSGIESSGTGAFNFITPGAILNAGLATSPRVLTLGGTYVGGANTMYGTFSDMGTGLTSLVKAGPGTWTLYGASTFTGGVTIENGLLNVIVATASNGGLGNGSPTTNVVRLGNANSTGDVTLAFGPTVGMFVGNPVVVSDLLPGTAKISFEHTSGTTSLGGNITLGATTNAGKSLTLAVPAGGTLAVTGSLLANGTDTTAGVNLVNSTGSGNATVTFSNNNTHAGFTTVNANTTLVINNAPNGLGANSATNTVNLAGGTLKYQNNRYVAGLKEAYTRSSMDIATAFESLTYYGVTNGPKMGYVSTANAPVRPVPTDTAWGATETWAYKGQVYIPATSTQISFSKSIDDAVWVSLDGVVLLNNGTWNELTGTGAKTVDVGVGGGWHNFEVRFGNGMGGAGAQTQGTGWTTTHGFGVSGMLGKALDTALVATNGNNYAAMVDVGGTLFRFDGGAINNLVLQNTINVTANSSFDQGADVTGITYGKLILNNSTLTTDATGAPGATTLSFGSTTPIGTAVISNSASSTLNLGALNDNGTAATLNFNGAGTLVMNTASTSLVAGSVIGVNAGKIVSSEGTALANATINVGASGLFEVAASQSIAGLTGSGSVTLNGYSLSIGAADNLSTTFSGVLSDGSAASGLTKTNNGTLTLSGNNSFTGTLAVNGGTLQFGSATAAGTTAAGTTVAVGAKVDLNGQTVGNEAFALSGELTNTSATAASLAGTVTLTGTGTVSANATKSLTLGGTVTGSGALTKTGAGTVVLNGANDFAGLTTVSAGTLQLGNASALGSTAAGTTVGATGTLDLNGLAIGAEAIALSGSLTNSSATAASLSGAVTLGASTASLVTNAGSLTFTGGLAVGSYTLAINGSGDVTVSGSSGLTGTGLVTKNGAGKLTLNAASAAGFDAINAGQVDAAGAINVETLENGTVNATAGATVTTMNNGVLNLGANSSVDSFNGGSINVGAFKLTVNDAATIPADVASLAFTGGELNYTGAAPFTRSFTVGNGGATFTAGSGSVITIGSSSQVDFANATGPGRTLTLAGTNTDASNYAPSLLDGAEAQDRLFSAVVKNGVGTWVIGGSANNFRSSATFDLNGGTLGFSSGALAGTGLITVSNSSTLRWEAANTNDVSGRLVVADGATATLDVGSNNVSFGNALGFGAAKTGAIVKQGSGALTLTQSNVFSGGFTVAAGTVTVNHVTALGSGLTVVNAGQLNLSVAIANDVTVNSGVVKGAATSGTMTLNSGATLSSGNAITTYNGGSVILNGGSVLEWKAYDTAGGAGVGYDRFNFGNLDLSNLGAGAKATIKLISHSDLIGAEGDANLAGSHSTPLGIVRTFNFGTVSGNLNLAAGQSVTDVFTFDVSSFTFAGSTPTTSDVWSMSFESGALTLTAVPEPSTYGFGIGALALALAAIRRRRKQAAAAKKNEA
jgi:fibronectin-binding autotransporter adhesin